MRGFLRRFHRTRGATLHEFFLLGVIFSLTVLGLAVGLKYQPESPILGGICGVVIGGLSGMGLALALMMVTLAYERLWNWWRPYPPVCENGICKDFRDYQSEEIPPETRGRYPGLSWLGHRCKCGNLYAGGFSHGLASRWVRVMPDGELRPYLIHRFCGRWARDAELRLGPGWGDRMGNWLDDRFQRHFPEWAISWLSGFMTMAIGVVVVYSQSGFRDAHDAWFVIALGVIGFLSGEVVRRLLKKES